MNNYKDMIDHIHPDETLIKETKDQLEKKATVYRTHKLVYACMLLAIIVPCSLIYFSSIKEPASPEDELQSIQGIEEPTIQTDELRFEPIYTKELTTTSKELVTNSPLNTTSLSEFYLSSSLHFLQQEQNTIYSPTSTAYALAMLTSGTTGTTKEQLEDFFSHSQIELEAILQSSYINLQTEGYMIDHSIWFDDRHALNIDTLQSLADLYFAKCFQTDFSNQAAVDEINEYVKVKSNHLLFPDFKAAPNQAIKLLNITALEARWNTQFHLLGYDYEHRFTLADGTKANVNTLYAVFRRASYEKTTQYEMSDLYLDNGFYMRVILPSQELSLQEFTKDQDLMQTIANTLLYPKEDLSVEFEMPEFSISNKWNLNPYLKANGVTSIFQPSSDFDLMGEDLFVNEINQLASIEVTQYGLRAAAATSIDAKTAGLNDNTSMLSMSVNRPFLYMIFSPMHELVFLGTVYDPAV